MADLITVRWSMQIAEAEPQSGWIARNCETLLPPWAAVSLNGEIAVQKICEDFFTEEAEAWPDWVGSEEDFARVQLTVHEPPELAALYEVTLTLRVKARAVRVPEARR